MLDINPEIVCSIIQKAREFHAKEGVTFPTVLPDETSDEADWLQTLADHSDDLTYLEVKEAINDLEQDQQILLVALMYVGRGDYSCNEWHAAMEEARYNWTPHTAEYLLSRPLVADYLEEALSLFGYSCSEE